MKVFPDVVDFLLDTYFPRPLSSSTIFFEPFKVGSLRFVQNRAGLYSVQATPSALRELYDSQIAQRTPKNQRKLAAWILRTPHIVTALRKSIVQHGALSNETPSVRVA